MKYNSKSKILIVDDERLNISIVAEILNQEYDLLVATNGEKVYQIVAADRKPDLILLDIVMPGISGFEVAQELKKNPETLHIPIIFLTAKHEMRVSSKDLIWVLSISSLNRFKKRSFWLESKIRFRYII